MDDGEGFRFLHKSAREKLGTGRAKSTKRIRKKMPFWRAVRTLLEKAPQPSGVFLEARAKKKRKAKFNVKMEDG